jgi:hypothetical protein
MFIHVHPVMIVLCQTTFSQRASIVAKMYPLKNERHAGTVEFKDQATTPSRCDSLMHAETVLANIMVYL